MASHKPRTDADSAENADESVDIGQDEKSEGVATGASCESASSTVAPANDGNDFVVPLTVPAELASDVVASHHQALVDAVLAVNPKTLMESIDVWKKAIADEGSLQKYAVAMETNARHKWSNHKGKFLWILTRLDEYYFGKGLVYSRLKDEKRSYFAEKGEQMGPDLIADRTAALAGESGAMVQAGVRLLDVGSCFDPIREILKKGSEGPKFPVSVEVTALDLCPTVPQVYKCDFLTLSTSPAAEFPASEATDQHLRGGEPLAVLPEGHYHAVVFSLLLEYLPTPEQRLLCVEKARDVLADNGVLFVITPRSTAKKNTAHKIKEWKAAIEGVGFTRWRYDEHLHVHCMAYRKIDPSTERQWVGKIPARKADIPVTKASALAVPRDMAYAKAAGQDGGNANTNTNTNTMPGEP